MTPGGRSPVGPRSLVVARSLVGARSLVTPRGLVGLGAGLTAAGLATAAGVATERLGRARRAERRTELVGEQERVLSAYDEPSDEELEVTTDDGVRLHVEVDHARRTAEGVAEGAAVPTVVFSHGYTLTLHCWVFQRRAAKAAGYRVVVWDARGHGLSGTGAPGSYDIDRLGRDLRAVIAAAVPDGPLVLVGHSMGGMTMMALAELDPTLIRDRVIGAAFVATSTGGLSAVHYGLGNALGRVVHAVGPHAVGRLARQQGLVTSARRAGKELEAYLIERYSFASPVPASVVQLMADMIFGTDLEVMSNLMPAFDKHDKREALAAFDGVETLVLNGAQDLLTPPEHSEDILRLVPGAEHVLVERAGHIVMLEHPALVNEQLLALVQRALRAAGQLAARRDEDRDRDRDRDQDQDQDQDQDRARSAP